MMNNIKFDGLVSKKQFILSLIFIFAIGTLMATGFKTKRYECYYRFDGSPVLTKSTCDYYAVFEAVEGLRNHRHGDYREYYADDSPKLFGQMSNNKRVGQWKGWHNNGQIRMEVEYIKTKGKSFDHRSSEDFPRVWKYWDQSGQLKVKNGNGCIEDGESNSLYAVREQGCYENGIRVGSWEGYDQLGELAYQENYHEDGSVQGTRHIPTWERPDYNDSETISYHIPKRSAQPDGGIKAFYQHIQENLIYPEEAKEKGIQGQVIVKFVIDKDDKLRNFRIMSDTDPLLNEAAVKAIIHAPVWEASKDRGLKVRTSRYFPLTFKLN